MCFHTGRTEESKWTSIFFQLNCGDLDTFLAFGKQLPRHTQPWNSAFAAACFTRFSCYARRCTMTFAFWRPQRWIKNSVQGLLWNFIIDFGKPSMHSTSLVDHFRGLLGTSFCPDVLKGGRVWGQKSRQSQGPRRSLWGLPFGVWLRVHKAWANARPGVGSLYCNGGRIIQLAMAVVETPQWWKPPYQGSCDSNMR